MKRLKGGVPLGASVLGIADKAEKDKKNIKFY